LLFLLDRTVTWGLVGILAAGAVGQIVRDRWPFLAWTFLLPMLPMGLLAACWDVVHRGRTLPWRYSLAIAGVLSGLVAAGGIYRFGGESPPTHASELRLVHWNVDWGGVPRDDEAVWDSLCETIERQEPDLLILSEGPGLGWAEALAKRLGWQMTSCWKDFDAYSAHLLVMAPGPVEQIRVQRIPDGMVLLAEARVDDRLLRVLVVDGENNAPRRSRTPMLGTIASFLDEQAAEGESIDLIAGDFNSVGRSVGFAALSQSGGGYVRAADVARGWIATWPARCPLYDIDHVWVSRCHRLIACELFGHRGADHRGHLVCIEPHQ